MKIIAVQIGLTNYVVLYVITFLDFVKVLSSWTEIVQKQRFYVIFQKLQESGDLVLKSKNFDQVTVTP